MDELEKKRIKALKKKEKDNLQIVSLHLPKDLYKSVKLHCLNNDLKINEFFVQLVQKKLKSKGSILGPKGWQTFEEYTADGIQPPLPKELYSPEDEEALNRGRQYIMNNMEELHPGIHEVLARAKNALVNSMQADNPVPLTEEVMREKIQKFWDGTIQKVELPTLNPSPLFEEPSDD